MRSNHVTLAILFAILVAPLRGEVIESTAAGFIVRNTATINAPSATVYAALTDSIGGWWDPAHTFSHDAHNLSLDAKPGGCFSAASAPAVFATWRRSSTECSAGSWPG